MRNFILSIFLTLTFLVSATIYGQTSFEPSVVRPLLDTQQRQAFTYFTNYVDTVSKMVFEGNDRGYNVITTGGSGFGVMALITGAERSWITRADAASRVRSMVRFLGKADRFHGVWSHWMGTDGKAQQFNDGQIKAGDLVETSFMMAGLLTAKEYFNTSDAVEVEIRDSVASFWNTIDWHFYTNGQNVLYWAWDSARPGASDQFVLPIQGWNEGMITYLLALAAPVGHSIAPNIYTQGWLNNNGMFHSGRTTYGYPYVLGGTAKGGPLFLSQYSFLGLDPRQMQDAGAFYWQQQVAHTMINREYCINQAPARYGYNEENWGLTACYGVGNRSYLAREPDNDDGVLAPTAAISAMPYTPFYSLQVFMNLAQQPRMDGVYGFADAYVPASSSPDSVTTKNLAIDQGPIVVMIENYRSGLIWSLLMKSTEVQTGLSLAGINKPTFSTGFPLVMKNEQTGVYDMVQHPDRGVYELPYYVQNTGQVLFLLRNSQNQVVRKFFVNAMQGNNTCSFTTDCNIFAGQAFTLDMYADGMINSLPIKLH